MIYSHWLLRSTLPHPQLPLTPFHSPSLLTLSPPLSLHSPSPPLTSPHPVLMAIISTSGFFLILGILKGAPPNLRPPTRRAPKRRTVWPTGITSTMIVQNGAAVPWLEAGGFTSLNEVVEVTSLAHLSASPPPPPPPCQSAAPEWAKEVTRESLHSTYHSLSAPSHSHLIKVVHVKLTPLQYHHSAHPHDRETLDVSMVLLPLGNTARYNNRLPKLLPLSDGVLQTVL